MRLSRSKLKKVRIGFKLILIHNSAISAWLTDEAVGGSSAPRKTEESLKDRTSYKNSTKEDE